MFYKYKCGNEIIRVFVWNDDFHNEVSVEDTKTQKSYDRTIREDENGNFIKKRENKYLTERFSLLIVDMNWRLTTMNELDKLLVEVDKIEDDDKWLEAEHDTVQQYCEDKNYEMTEDEMETIRSRGLEESFESWIEFKEMMEE